MLSYLKLSWKKSLRYIVCFLGKKLRTNHEFNAFNLALHFKCIGSSDAIDLCSQLTSGYCSDSLITDFINLD